MSTSAPPRRLVVLRHGETEHNAAGIWQGHLDSELSPRGRAQADQAAAAIAALRPTFVVASDLVRAAETGERVARAGGIPLTLDDRLREIHAGAWQGMRGVDVRAQYPDEMDKLLRGEDFRRGGDGESVADVAARTAAALAEVTERLEPGECAVLATHGVAGRAIVADLVGLAQMDAWRILGGLGNAHWAQLEDSRGGWRLMAWNLRAPDADGGVSSIA